ncbi:MAG: hypothetical protein MJB14_20440, partial [Spirochaetes bacterium]|nr:hypothetical protein [Spirochaetota bacterium]
KMTLSFWTRLVGSSNDRITTLRIHYGDECKVLLNRSNNGWDNFINVNGNYSAHDSTSLYSETDFFHVYIVMDKNAGLSNGKAVRVYINNHLVMEHDETFNLVNDFSISYEGNNSSTEIAYYYFDNIKIWDYIVSENPSWETQSADPENILIPSDLLKPIYFSKCESIANHTTEAEIGNAEIVEGAFYDIISGSNYSKYGNAIRELDNNTGNTKILYQNTQSNQGTISFWGQMSLIESAIDIRIGSGLQILLTNENQNPFLRINGNVVDSYSSGINSNLHHFYIIWDKSGNLQNNDTIQVYIDGSLYMNSSVSLNDVDEDITFNYRALNNSYVTVDNLKIWEYVVSTNPNWENESSDPENVLTYEDPSSVPDFWSDCETVDSLTNSANIYDSDNPPVLDNTGGFSAVVGKINNAIQAHFNPQQKQMYYPFGQNFTTPDEFTMSFYLQLESGASHKQGLNIYLNDIDSTIGFTNDQGTWNHSLKVDGVHDQSTSNVDLGSDFKHIYIIGDKNAGLAGGTSLKVYIDGQLEISYNQSFTTGNFSMYFHCSIHSGDNSWIKMDDLKIWKKVYSENPNDVYNDSNDQETNLLDGPGKYIVFKIAKNPFMTPAIIDKTNIENKIKFIPVGTFWDTLENRTKEIYNKTLYPNEPHAIELTTADQYYIEGNQYLYYIVKKANLKSYFETATEAASLFTDLNGYDIANNIVIDPGSLRIEYELGTNYQPVDIYVTGDDTLDHANDIQDIIVYDYSYEDSFDPETDTEIQLKSELSHELFTTDDSTTDRTFVHQHTSSSEYADYLTINFWFRVEDEYINPNEDLYDSHYRKLFTVAGDNINSELIHLGYNGNELKLFDNLSNNTILSITNSNSIAPNLTEWNMATFQFDPATGKVELLLNKEKATFSDGTNSVEMVLLEEFMNQILSQDSRFYFGASPGNEYNTGFFSIAKPYYINKELTLADLTRLYTLKDQSANGDQEYWFTSNKSDFMAGANNLRELGSGTDYVYTAENADFNEPVSNGSLKASTAQRNYLVQKETENPGMYRVILADADNPIRYNLTETSYDTYFELEPKASGEGSYFFGDKNSNYGLGQDKWYSISGEVLSITDGTAANLFLRINGKEQSFPLTKGKFHFIYNNPGEMIPSDVKLYIKTNGKIALSTDMKLNEGNYILPDGLEPTG